MPRRDLRARAWDNGDPARSTLPFSVRLIVFNVTGEDLMFIDAPNRHLTADHPHRAIWSAMGVEPRPFEDARFFAPCAPAGPSTNREAARVRRNIADDDRQARPYYWTLSDVVRLGLWSYLFSDSAQGSEPMMALADHILDLIAEDCTAVCPNRREHPAGLHLRTINAIDGQPVPQSFKALRTWLRGALRDKGHAVRDGGIHAFSSCRALALRPEEKLVNAGGHWMNLLVPFPAWAMKKTEIDDDRWGTTARPATPAIASPGTPSNGTENGVALIPLNLTD